MKSWLSSTLLVAGLLLAAIAAACGGGGGGGGGGELTLEQYFDQVNTIVAGLEQRASALDQPLEQTFDSEEEQIEAFRDAFTVVLPFFQDFINDLDEMDAPAEVADAHSELVAGFANLVEGVDDLVNQLAEIESVSEFLALLLDPDSGFGSAIVQLATACLQLQSAADDNNIDADLECAG